MAYNKYSRKPTVKYIANEQIRGEEFRVINGEENLGVLKRSEIFKIAQEEGKDVVLIAPQAQPQVVKIVELSKYKYQMQQKAQKAKAKSKQQELKEFRLGVSTGENDAQIRVNRARKFLKGGDKVKFTLRFRGREIIHKDLGFEKIMRVVTELADISEVEREPKKVGNQIEVVLKPK